MAQLALGKEFLTDYRKLDQQIQKKVDESIEKFSAHTFAGLHLEAYNNARDPRLRTIRFGKNFRGIVMAPDEGEVYVLVHVLPHDQADQWAMRNQFAVNAATGALEVTDVIGVEAFAEAITASAKPRGILDKYADKDMMKLGLPEALLPILRRAEHESEIEGLCVHLPESQAEALRMLLAGYSIEDAWAELLAGENPGVVDPEDIAASLTRPVTQAMYYVANDAHDVIAALNQPFDLWRIFLHPSQRRLAERPVFNGPVRVTGGAGTGKTVVAIHRAKYLANLSPAKEKDTLFTTFTKNLAVAIEHQLKSLGGADLLDKIDVINIDKVAVQILSKHERKSPRIISDKDQNRLWQEIANEHSLAGTLGPVFLRQEWQQVVLAQEISTRDQYLQASRPGRGTRLDRRQRALVWRAIDDFTLKLIERNERTFLQAAALATRFAAAAPEPMYRHVLVDEAQDLHPAQWRLIRALVPEGQNDLFIVGDAHQRIYDNRVTLSKVGINVRGRSHQLKINYRTTSEILTWSLGLLTGAPADDLDGGTETLQGYRSTMHGGQPETVGYPDVTAELTGLAQSIHAWQDAGAALDSIGVTARRSETCELIVESLTNHGIPAALISAEALGTKDSVHVGTMHRMKGLEYKCLAVVDVSKDKVPPRYALTPVDVDKVEHELDVMRERALLFVACTRARDALKVSWQGSPSMFIENLVL